MGLGGERAAGGWWWIVAESCVLGGLEIVRDGLILDE